MVAGTRGVARSLPRGARIFPKKVHIPLYECPFSKRYIYIPPKKVHIPPKNLKEAHIPPQKGSYTPSKRYIYIPAKNFKKVHIPPKIPQWKSSGGGGGAAVPLALPLPTLLASGWYNDCTPMGDVLYILIKIIIL